MAPSPGAWGGPANWPNATPWPAPARALAPPPTSPVASIGQRIGGRLLDAIVAVVLFVVPLLWIPNDRLLARLFTGAALIAAYEASFVIASGSTPGKVIANTRVAALDQSRVEPGDAIKRGLLVALATGVVLMAPVLLLGLANADRPTAVLSIVIIALAAGIGRSVFGSPVRRSFIDRVCGTFVVVRSFTGIITTEMVDDLSDERSAPVAGRWGRMATFEERRRGRTGRLDDAPLLILALLAIVFATSIPHPNPWVLALLGAIWEVLFVLDETWRVSRWGATSGHRSLGLAVVDVDTGEPPSSTHSFVRAALVSLPLYVLPAGAVTSVALLGDHPMMLVPLVICSALLLGFMVWLRMSPGRGVHDLAAHTAVVRLARPHPETTL